MARPDIPQSRVLSQEAESALLASDFGNELVAAQQPVA